MVDTGIAMLPHISVRILVESETPFEIRHEVLLFLHNLGLRSQFVIEWITLLLLEPIWDLVVSHVLYFHFARHCPEGAIHKF